MKIKRSKLVIFKLPLSSSEDDQFNQFQRNVQQQQFDEMNRHFTEESLKSVTPFEMGGYDMTQGNSWNNNDFGGMF